MVIFTILDHLIEHHCMFPQTTESRVYACTVAGSRFAPVLVQGVLYIYIYIYIC